MAKKKRDGYPGEKRKRGRPKKESTNGSGETATVVSMADRMTLDQSSSDLGDIVLPDGETAVKVLEQLAQLYRRRHAQDKVCVDYGDKLKVARSKLNDIDAEIASLIRRATHKTALPLFDAKEREADLQRIQEQASAPAPAAEPAPDTPVEPIAAPVEPPSEAAGNAPDDVDAIF